jgi:hypothetical protein
MRKSAFRPHGDKVAGRTGAPDEAGALSSAAIMDVKKIIRQNVGAVSYRTNWGVRRTCGKKPHLRIPKQFVNLHHGGTDVRYPTMRRSLFTKVPLVAVPETSQVGAATFEVLEIFATGVPCPS